jgi:hypothetical protein
MPDELFKKQREGYMVKKVEIPKKIIHSLSMSFSHSSIQKYPLPSM